jgi:hypothetical protein
MIRKLKTWLILCVNLCVNIMFVLTQGPTYLQTTLLLPPNFKHTSKHIFSHVNHFFSFCVYQIKYILTILTNRPYNLLLPHEIDMTSKVWRANIL